MDWVKKFYTTQNDWFAVYLGDLDPSHQLRSSLVEQMTNNAPKQILELGAGGGQTAVVLAQEGHQVTTIELLEESTHHAHQLAKHYGVAIEILQGDFYTIPLEKTFDLVCYFDSFGIGTDEEQQQLLRRVANWLKPNGTAIIEVGSTWYWGGIGKNKSLDLGDCIRNYSFDALRSIMIDKWWRKDDPDNAIYQYLRCYTPADIRLLLKGIDLELDMVEAGGKIDYRTTQFIVKTSLAEAMTYYIKLTKK